MPVSQRVVGDVAFVAVEGELTAGSGACALLRDAVRTVLREGRLKLVIDLGTTTRLDSTGLGEIVHAYASTTNKGGAFRLCRPSRRAMELLVITKLVPVLRPTETEADAIAALSAPAVKS